MNTGSGFKFFGGKLIMDLNDTKNKKTDVKNENYKQIHDVTLTK